MTNPEPTKPSDSPAWSSTTKLLVGLTFVAIIAALLARFQSLLGPLVLAFMLTYLLQPLVESLSRSTRLSWRISVNVVFIILVIVLISLFTATGFAVVQQFQSLVRVIDRFVTGLPEMIADLAQKSFVIGPYQIDLSRYFVEDNLTSIADQVLSAVQPLLGQAGGLLATLASQTASTLGWAVFVVLVAYFLLADMTRMPKNLLAVEIPQYDADFRRLAHELGVIWNAFLRGQVI